MRQSKLIRKTFLWISVFAGISIQILFLACTKERRRVIDDSTASSSSGPPTISTIQVDVFQLGCSVSGCHDNRATPASNMNLTSAAQTYDALVNQVSGQVPQLKLVDPGFPEKSYLVNKLRGTHLSVGGIGDRMPQYAAALTEGDLQRIEEWITNGALRN